MTQRLIAAYQKLLAAGTIEPEPSQQIAVTRLQTLARELASDRSGFWPTLSGLWGRRASSHPRGVYLHGAVGRGKTMLMDLFFREAGLPNKRRLHFDAFMTEAHAAIETARRNGTGDPIPAAARKLIGRSLLICIDEFQINDIADAMIVGRLFEQVFAAGVVLVATSNTPPADLYPDGINRLLFLPFVSMLLKHVDLVELTGRRDYRLSKLIGRQLYFAPADAAATAALGQVWALLTGNVTGAPYTLDVGGHKLTVPRSADGTAWTSFNDLCAKPLGASDYRALARAFHTLILQDVPVLGPAQRNEARRFITLIDALYDQRRRLIVSAAAEPDALYPAGDGAETFRRTASRLAEMRSEDYLETPRPAPESMAAFQK